MKNMEGVTILEVLVTLAIVSIIASLGFFTYTKWQSQVQLLNVRDEMVSAIVRAQQLASAAADTRSWGIHLEEDRYIMFPGSFYNESDPDNVVWNLNGIRIISPTTTFTDGVGGRISDVVFIKFTGQTFNTGTISIVTTVDPIVTKTITIPHSGQFR